MGKAPAFGLLCCPLGEWARGRSGPLHPMDGVGPRFAIGEQPGEFPCGLLLPMAGGGMIVGEGEAEFGGCPGGFGIDRA